MKKIKIVGYVLVSIFLFVCSGNFIVAQESSYVGISEGEEYIWDLGLNKDGVYSLKNDCITLINDTIESISTTDLGDYTNLNASEAILLAYDDYVNMINNLFAPGLIPDDWKMLNISAFMENSIDKSVETFNATILSGAIPDEWKSDSIVNFFDHVIDGLNKTIPGFEDYSLSEILELIINTIDDTFSIDVLPVGWEDMTISSLIELYMGNIFDFINTTLLPGMVPLNWLYMDLPDLVQNMFPILPQTLIDQIENMTSGYDIFSIFESYAQSLNYSLGGLIPGDWDELSIPELVFPIIFQGYQDYNLSYTLDAFFEALNSTVPFDLYSVDMSYLINMTISNFATMVPPDQRSIPINDLLKEQVSAMLYAINSTYSSYFPENWMSLSIDELRSYYISQAQLMFNQFLVQVDTYLYQFELLGGFQKFSLKAIIDHIGDELELIPGGPKGVPINVTFQIKVEMSDWTNLTDLIGLNIFQYYQMYVLDPTTFPIDEGALIEQFLSTGSLFIGKGYDWSGIDTNYVYNVPDVNKDITFDMNWNSKGVLDHIRLDYNDQEVAAIELQTTTTEPEIIPGYPLLVFSGILLLSIGIIVTSIKKKHIKF
jgi:hypothetical protein